MRTIIDKLFRKLGYVQANIACIPTTPLIIEEKRSDVLPLKCVVKIPYKDLVLFPPIDVEGKIKHEIAKAFVEEIKPHINFRRVQNSSLTHDVGYIDEEHIIGDIKILIDREKITNH